MLTALALVCGLALSSPVGALAAPRPAAHAAANCNLAGHYRSLGVTYVERLSVSGTSCANGINLIRAYTKCRLRAGGPRGRCRSNVYGFRFVERRSASPVQFVALVRATRGRTVVTFAYTENV